MKTPKSLFFILTLLLISTTYLPIGFAQDYTTLNLPEGAKARLGKGSINEIAYSPDGSMLAVASSLGTWFYDSDDGTVYLWDVFTGRLKTELIGHSGIVFSLAFSPDGQTLASGGYAGTVGLWDVATNGLISPLIGHTDSVYSVAFSPDGQTLASGDEDDTVRLWDVATGTLKNTLTGHTGAVLSVAFSPDGNTIANVSSDDTILWDVATGTLKNTITHGYINTIL